MASESIAHIDSEPIGARGIVVNYCTTSCESPRFQILHMVYFIQHVQKCRRYKEFEIYVKISTGTTISQEMWKQTVNKNNIHVPVGVSQVSQLVVMILLINDCYVVSLVVIISRMNFVLYRNNYQGCALRKIDWSPVLWNCEIQGAQLKEDFLVDQEQQPGAARVQPGLSSEIGLLEVTNAHKVNESVLRMLQALL